MRSLAEIQSIPVGLLTDAEINALAPTDRVWALKWKTDRAREDACIGHERICMTTRDQANRGWHISRCKHCNKDMSWDSSD